MKKITNRIPKSILTTVLPMLLASNMCWASFAFEVIDSFDFLKNSVTIENTDKGNFEGTAFTSNWRSNKEFITYNVTTELIYVNECTNLYGKIAANYGWVITGKVNTYPLRWNVDGNSKGLDFETGYFMNVCDRFKFIPYVGYQIDFDNLKIKGQHFGHTSPSSFVSQNGNKSFNALYFPYIGVEFDFIAHFCNCYDIQFLTSYQFGYGWGHGRNTVHRFHLTDNPETSRYGNHLKYRDMISHDFEIGAAYNIDKKWQIKLNLDYNTIYNTHKLPLKFQHNDEIVESGQFTPSQRHYVSETISHKYSIILGIIYNFSGESGGTIR